MNDITRNESRLPLQERAIYPAQCNGCETLSDPRPLGQTPDGWKRGETVWTATFTGQGRYFCEDCWTAVKPR